MLLAVACVAYLALAVGSARLLSASTDETVHLASGISYWKLGDFRMNPEHPPLAKALAGGLAIVGNDVRCEVVRPDGAVLGAWEDGNQSRFGNILLYRMNDADALLAWARWAPILLGLLGGLACAWWGRELGGALAGALAGALLLTYPEYLGHARYVTFDVPTAAMATLCSATLWRWWRRPGPGRAAAFLAAALAGCLTKLTVGVFIVLLLLCAGAASLLVRRAGRRSATFAQGTALVGALVVGVVAVFWAASGFRFSLVSPAAPALKTPSAFVDYAELTSGVSKLTRPLWKAHLLPETLLAMVNHTGSFTGRLTFLRGETSRDGFATYFFWTTLYKTPLALLLVLAGGALAAARQIASRPRGLASPRTRFRLLRALFWCAPFAGLLAMTIVSRANLGHRYILFAYVPACILAGWAAARAIRRGGPALRWAAIAAAVVAPVVTLATTFPDYSSYFSPVAGGGGPVARSRLLVDSNIDWGQDLKRLGEWVRTENGGAPINLAYFGTADPAYYGVRDFHFILPSYPFAVLMPEAKLPDPARATAVSINCLDSVRLLFPEQFGREPDVVLNSIVIWLPAQK